LKSLLFVLSLVLISRVEAQTPSLENSPSLSDFLIVDSMGITQVNLDANNTISISEYDARPLSTNSNEILLDVEWNKSTNALFAIRGPFARGDSTPITTQLVHLDVTSGMQRVLYERQTIWSLSVNRDGTQIAISYFEGRIGLSNMWMCIFVLQTGQCSESRLINNATQITWIDNQTVFIFNSGVDLFLLDSLTLRQTGLVIPDWFINSAVYISGTRSILLAAVATNPLQSLGEPDRLLMYNLDTGMTTMFGYQLSTVDTAFTLQMSLQASPDGYYVAIYGANTVRIIDLRTVRLIVDVPNISWVIWTQENAHALMIQTGNIVGQQLISVDIQTGTQTIIPIDVTSKYVIGL
jgi:hypothetical protein